MELEIECSTCGSSLKTGSLYTPRYSNSTCLTITVDPCTNCIDKSVLDYTQEVTEPLLVKIEELKETIKDMDIRNM